MRLPYLHASGGLADTTLFVYSLLATAGRACSPKQGRKDTKRLNNSQMTLQSIKKPFRKTGRACRSFSYGALRNVLQLQCTDGVVEQDFLKRQRVFGLCKVALRFNIVLVCGSVLHQVGYAQIVTLLFQAV